MNRSAGIIALVVGVSVVVQAGPSSAAEQPWWSRGGKGDAAQPAAAPAAPPVSDGVKKAQAMQEWKLKLMNSRWDLEVVVSPPGGPRVVESDTLTFDDRSLSSSVLDKAGFDRAEFSLYPPEGESISFEAMQRKAGKNGEDTAIWRAEVTGETLRGTLIRRSAEGKVDNFSFTGKRLAAAPEAPADPVGQVDPVSPGVPVDSLEPGAPQPPPSE